MGSSSNDLSAVTRPSPAFPNHHGRHEGHEGHEGDEGDEGHEGHEGEEGVDHRQGEVRTDGCVPWQQGEDPRGPEEDRPDEEQDREDREQEGQRQWQEGLRPHQGWTTAVQKARKALGVKGFQAVKKGSPLYKKAKELLASEHGGPRTRESARGTLRRPPRRVGSSTPGARPVARASAALRKDRDLVYLFSLDRPSA